MAPHRVPNPQLLNGLRGTGWEGHVTTDCNAPKHAVGLLRCAGLLCQARCACCACTAVLAHMRRFDVKLTAHMLLLPLPLPLLLLPLLLPPLLPPLSLPMVSLTACSRPAACFLPACWAMQSSKPPKPNMNGGNLNKTVADAFKAGTDLICKESYSLVRVACATVVL